MIILPTIYRPESLRRFVKAYETTGATLPVFVVLDKDNVSHYSEIELPKFFTRCSAHPGTRIGDIFNKIYNAFPNESFYGVMADDVVPETYRWDILLKEACLPDRIAWGFDGGHDETLPRHPFIGGDLVRKMGFLSAPGVKHWYVDNAWKDIAEGLNCGAYRPEIRMVHRHYTNGLAQKDRTYTEQPNPRVDEFAYNMWKEQELPDLLRRLKA